MVIALSPTARVWSNVGPGRDGELLSYQSSWTWREQPSAAWRPAMADEVLNYNQLGRLTSLGTTQPQLIRSLPDDPIDICAAAHGLVMQLIFA